MVSATPRFLTSKGLLIDTSWKVVAWMGLRYNSDVLTKTLSLLPLLLRKAERLAALAELVA